MIVSEMFDRRMSGAASASAQSRRVVNRKTNRAPVRNFVLCARTLTESLPRSLGKGNCDR